MPDNQPQSFNPSGFTSSNPPRPSSATPPVSPGRREARASYRINRGSTTTKTAQVNPPRVTKKMTGVGFMIMLGLVCVKEFLDVGVNLTGFLAIFTFLPSMIISGVLIIYYWVNGVTPTIQKAGVWFFGLAVGAIPFLSFLPETIMSFLIIRYLENSAIAKLAVTQLS